VAHVADLLQLRAALHLEKSIIKNASGVAFVRKLLRESSLRKMAKLIAPKIMR